MARNDTALRHAIIEFYREEMRKRYLLRNIRRFDAFDGVPNEQIHALRDYFMEHIYPPCEDRDRLDDAISRMGDVIKSPRRLRPLVGATLSSVFKLGTSLPTALSAGNSTLDAYLEARKLESFMLEAAKRSGVTEADARDYESMIGILAEVPEKEVMRLIKGIMKLFRALSNTKMLQTAVDFLGRCAEIMTERPELYHESEVEGIRLGRAMVQGGLDLFLDMPPDQFPGIIRGIEEIELDWYNTVRENAQGA